MPEPLYNQWLLAMHDYFLDKYFLSFYTYIKKNQTTEIILKKHERRSFYPSIKSGIKDFLYFLWLILTL